MSFTTLEVHNITQRPVGPSHGHRQHPQNIWYRLRLWFGIYPRRQTHRHVHHNNSQPLPRAK